MKFILILIVSLSIFSCKSTKTNNAKAQEDQATSVSQGTKDKLLVQLKAHIKPGELETEFVKYMLKNKSIASKSENTYLFTFNPETISQDRLIKKINKYEGVVLASKLQSEMKPARSFESGTKKTVILEKSDQ